MRDNFRGARRAVDDGRRRDARDCRRMRGGAPGGRGADSSSAATTSRSSGRAARWRSAATAATMSPLTGELAHRFPRRHADDATSTAGDRGRRSPSRVGDAVAGARTARPGQAVRSRAGGGVLAEPTCAARRYLQLKDGRGGRCQFQSIVDHRGEAPDLAPVPAGPPRPRARRGARRATLPAARACLRRVFRALGWGGRDPSSPLTEARREYARLQ